MTGHSQISLSLDSSKIDSTEYLIEKLLETKLQVIYVISNNTSHSFGELVKIHVPEIQAFEQANELLSKYSINVDSIFSETKKEVSDEDTPIVSGDIVNEVTVNEDTVNKHTVNEDTVNEVTVNEPIVNQTKEVKINTEKQVKSINIEAPKKKRIRIGKSVTPKTSLDTGIENTKSEAKQPPKKLVLKKIVRKS